MSGRTNFKEIREKLRADPEHEPRVRAAKAVYDVIERLAQLRQARGVTQEVLATALQVSQENISRIERQQEVYMSTVVKYVDALGGKVVFEAVFEDDDQHIDLTQILAFKAKEARDSHAYQA